MHTINFYHLLNNSTCIIPYNYSPVFIIIYHYVQQLSSLNIFTMYHLPSSSYSFHCIILSKGWQYIYTITFRPSIVMQYIQLYIQSFHPHSIFSPYYFYHLSCIVIALLYFIITRLIQQCRHCMYSFFLLICFMVERHKVKRQSSLLYDVT